MAETADLKRLIKSRALIKANVTRVITFFTSNPESHIDAVETRNKKLEENYQNFLNVQTEIDILVEELNDETLQEAQEIERAEFDDQYFKCAELINRRFRELKPNFSELKCTQISQSVPTINVQQTNSLLPQIEIKPFDGNLLHWRAFRNAFESLVHNSNNIPVSHKFYLLKNSLCGEIATLIDDCEGSAEDYEVAWDLIKKRCEKPRKIVNSHLQALFDLPSIVKESPSSLRLLRENAQKHVNSLKLLNEPIATWDSILVYIVSQKLDKITRRGWERTLDDDQKPIFNDLMTFISKQERGDEFESNSLIASKFHNSSKKPIHRPQSYVGMQKQLECNYCKEQHSIYKCEQFLKLNPRERGNIAKIKNLCLNCLRSNHSTNKCNASGCKKCNRKHNTLLHFAISNNISSSQITGESSKTPEPNEQTTHGFAVTYDSEVLLGTARIKILDKNNHEHICRVLLDGCSQSNFITEKLANLLELKQEKINIPFAGLGQLTTRANFRVKTKIISCNNLFEAVVEFVALPTITDTLPSRHINKKSLQLPQNIQLADPEFDKPAEIDALIGTTLFYKLLSNGQINLGNSNVTLQKTLLGWIIAGEVETKLSKSKTNCYLITTLEKQLSRFWEIEEIPSKKHLSIEEETCEHFYTDTTKREVNGRYIVQLPFNERKNEIGSSYYMALKRYYSLEKKLSKDNVLKQEYNTFLREYRDLGHMSDISASDKIHEGYYIPHHAVVKEQNVTTKVRVVFDASAKSTTNVSLNDTLLVGPTIQDDLIILIMRFRLHNIVLTADLQKMYRQIKIEQTDAIYQKILWRENPNDKIQVFRLNTVTQGTATAPFLAARTLRQLAIDEGKDFPLAAESLKNDFYVDDFLSGASSLQEALDMKNQLIALLKRGGFEIHKWASNNPELVQNLTKQENANVCLDSSKKLLGIHWNPNDDTIKYVVQSISMEKRITKRTILSHIAQLFDPLGILGPVVVVAKLIMQDLWKAKLHWDESITQELYIRWMQFTNNLHLLNTFKVNRQVICRESITCQLHGFCDASQSAYGAVVYIRTTNSFNECKVQLICAKSRVAPVKTLTIPRLELCAALLLAKLIGTVEEALKLAINKKYLWSDSTIVLNWLKTSPHMLKTFVANRISEIQTITNTNDWHHISTNENPADFISRGQTTMEFIKNKLWLHGPIWLDQTEDKWCEKQLSKITVPEQRLKVTLIGIKNDNNTRIAKNEIFERFSSFIRLTRFVAFCHRAITSWRCRKQLSGNYNVDELREAHNQIIKLVQEMHYALEIKKLNSHEMIHSKSSLLPLNPFIDKDGIIRVGGRLKHSTMDYSKKYPILLPRNEHITKLIIRNEHEKNWHSGVQATLNSVRQNYWPIDGKNITRYIINKCIRCARLNPKFPHYRMGDLPKNRVTQSRPFENVGLDYCGPFLIKERKLRNTQKVKSYVSVFVCFATKAIHLELVTDLTTETCLEAVKRFISRRGKPRRIFSDNATNFIGAKSEILRVQAFLSSNQNNSVMSNYLQNESIEWHFSPPRSPHFGGLWEAAVKSFKHHLYRTVGGALFTYEQFNTFIIEIESILNSRPLTPLSCDPNDLSALTPAHFILGTPTTSLPEYNYQDVPVNRLSMWQRIQQIKQHFWKRWHKEYLNELRTRSKWHNGDGSQIKIGTLVTIKEDNLPSMQWSLGRIVEVHPGEDNIVRVATVKTSSGVYKRCVKRLSPLPIDC